MPQVMLKQFFLPVGVNYRIHFYCPENVQETESIHRFSS